MYNSTLDSYQHFFVNYLKLRVKNINEQKDLKGWGWNSRGKEGIQNGLNNTEYILEKSYGNSLE